MSKVKYYRQCKLKKLIKGEEGVERFRILVTWLPEKKAQIGKWLKLKIDGAWENHWLVCETWEKKEARFVEDKERDFKKQREASDI
jgi:hypothetical protein